MRFWRVIEPYIGFLLQGFALTVAACLLAIVFLGEIPDMAEGVSIALIVGGVLLAMKLFS